MKWGWVPTPSCGVRVPWQKRRAHAVSARRDVAATTLPRDGRREPWERATTCRHGRNADLAVARAAERTACPASPGHQEVPEVAMNAQARRPRLLLPCHGQTRAPRAPAHARRPRAPGERPLPGPAGIGETHGALSLAVAALESGGRVYSTTLADPITLELPDFRGEPVGLFTQAHDLDHAWAPPQTARG